MRGRDDGVSSETKLEKIQGQSTYEYILYLGRYTPGKRQLKVFEIMKSLDWICLLEILSQPR